MFFTVTCCYWDSLSLPGDRWSGEALNLAGKNSPMIQHYLHFVWHGPDLWQLCVHGRPNTVSQGLIGFIINI